jgi:hypothetical protein
VRNSAQRFSSIGRTFARSPLMNATDIRCDNDLKLFGQLLERQEVQQANERIAVLKEEGQLGVRRRLLATSVRLSRGMARSVHKISDKCIERLGIDIPLELYVYPSPHYNAACIAPEAGQLFIMFSSSLLEAFVGRELSFVVGHELGHHLYRHHEIPVAFILQGPERPDPRLVLDLFAWSRYAEISADRAGAHCSGDPRAIAAALFKLASGLSGKTISFDLDEFLSQLDEMQAAPDAPSRGADREDWFSTHPFSPMRVKALQLFHESEFAVAGGTPAESLELAVQKLMMLMEPSYLDGHTDAAEAMRRLLFAAAMIVAHASGSMTEAEIAVFEQFFGKGSFVGSIDIKKLREELSNRIEQAREKASLSQRMQVLRDLCLMARAEKSPTAAARKLLADVAEKLEVRRQFIDETLCGRLDPD